MICPHCDVNVAAGLKGAYKSKAGPSEIIATPVFYKNRVYVAVGQDPTHGKGQGALVCIDATKKGNLIKSGKVWVFKSIGRSLSTVAIDNNLLYTADENGMVYCLDAITGKLYWKHDTQKPIYGSAMVADKKVYVGNEGGCLWVFAVGKVCKALNVTHIGSPISATPTAANGVLYVQTQTKLYAIIK